MPTELIMWLIPRICDLSIEYSYCVPIIAEITEEVLERLHIHLDDLSGIRLKDTLARRPGIKPLTSVSGTHLPPKVKY